MKKLLSCLLLAAVLAVPTAAQTMPPPYPLTPLPAEQVYALLLPYVGDPRLTYEAVTRSRTAYGLYFTVDQALALVPRDDDENADE